LRCTFPNEMKNLRKHSLEWLKAFLWAALVAWLLRTFFIQGAFIPAHSMNNTLMAGDYIFISKTAYGPRLPLTPLSVPFLHQHLPFGSETPAYLNWIQLPYFRLGSATVNAGDIVVFNYPLETEAPIDKRTLYIKRCVALPGDSIQLFEKKLKRNGKWIAHNENMLFKRHVKAAGPLKPEWLDSLNIRNGMLVSNMFDYEFPLNDSLAASLEKVKYINKVSLKFENKDEFHAHIFPHHKAYPYNNDFWGPCKVPKKGNTVLLNDTTIELYRRIITQFEGHELTQKNGSIYIDKKATTTYTFEKNYFFMLGDNRDYSVDSRYWGFVPEDHIVGKAWRIFFSHDPDKNSIRWNRIFKFIE
jgi:signal peptidase I